MDPGVEAPLLSPAPGTAPPWKQCPPRRGEDFLVRALPARPRPAAGSPSPHPRGRERRVLPSRPPPRPRWPHKLPEGGVGCPHAYSAPQLGLSLCPRALRGASWGGGARRPGQAAAAAGSPLIVRGGGGCGGGGGAPEPRQDVAEAVVAVQLGLALGALDRALEAAAEEALRAGRQEGEGEAGLARHRRARDPRGTRALARAAERPRAGAGSGSAPAARCPLRPPADRAPTARPAQRGPAHPTPPACPPATSPPPPKPLLPWRRRAEPRRPRPRTPEPPRRGGGGSPSGPRGAGLRRGGNTPPTPGLRICSPLTSHCKEVTPPSTWKNPRPLPTPSRIAKAPSSTQEVGVLSPGCTDGGN